MPSTPRRVHRAAAPRAATRRATRRAAAVVLATTALVATGLTGSTPAVAAPGDTLDVSPPTASVAAGGCQVLTVTLRTNGAVSRDRVVDVVLTERTPAGGAATETQDVDFCTVAGSTTTPTVAPTADTAAGSSATGNDEDKAEFTTGADGTFRFGVTGRNTGPSAADVVVFVDDATTGGATADNERLDTGEVTDSSVVTFTSGAVDDVATVAVTPSTASRSTGEQHTLTATLRNGAGDAVPGIRPVADITSGPDNAVTPTCTVSDNAGQSTCTFTTGGAPGTDQITVYVNQTDPDNNPATNDTANDALNSGEPSANARLEVTARPSGLQVDLTCGPTNGDEQARTSAEDCLNPLSTTGTVFTARVTRADGGDADSARDAAPGVALTFTVGGTGADGGDTETLSRTSATTGGDGTASVTLTDSRPSESETLTVTVTVVGQDPAGDRAQDSPAATGEISSDTASVTSRSPAAATARTVTITSSAASSQTGTTRVLTATVRSRSGERVPGVRVAFTEAGAGRFVDTTVPLVRTTDASGTARVETTSSEVGDQIVTATIDRGATECDRRAGDPNGAPAGVCATSVTSRWTAPPPPPAPPVGAVTLEVNDASVTAGNAPLLSGRVTDTAGAPLRGQTVTIVQKAWGEAAYRTLETTPAVTTDADGRWSLRVRPDRQTAYAARTGTAQSRVLLVTVANRVNIARPVGGERLTPITQVTGDLDPDEGSVRVGVAVIKDGRFTYVAQGVTASDGSYAIRVRLPVGVYPLVVYTSARQGRGPGAASRAVSVD